MSRARLDPLQRRFDRSQLQENLAALQVLALSPQEVEQWWAYSDLADRAMQL